VARAADVPQKRDPVDRVAHRFAVTACIAEPYGQQARPQLRLERLAERVVLAERERAYEFAEAERGDRNGEISRCFDLCAPAKL